MTRCFPSADLSVGRARLEAWLTNAGAAYAAGRNYAEAPFWAGSGESGTDAALERGRISALSPWLRTRQITEADVAVAAYRRHGAAAEKFVQEVCWRTYWKGWLELRPSRWSEFCRLAAIAQPRAVEQAIARAEAGATGIEAFDAWVDALRKYGWLHNHERMWFASIWIFTLGLPWARGADFFMRHLLDGDSASNTLSWRWVAGLQTPGKHYLARADNIARFTRGRFDPRGRLEENAEALPFDGHPPADERRLPSARWISAQRRAGGAFDATQPTMWLLHDDDLSGPAVACGHELQIGESCTAVRQAGGPDARCDALAVLETTARRTSRSEQMVDEGVVAWTAAASAQFSAQLGFSLPELAAPRSTPTHGQSRRGRENDQARWWRASATNETALWLQVTDDFRQIAASGVRQVACAWMPVGPNRDLAERLVTCATEAGLEWWWWSRAWDRRLWPHATHGFFRFKGAIMPLITALDDESVAEAGAEG